MRWLFKREGQRKRYASAIELLEKSNIASLRKRTKILVVDDEDEEIYEVLKERQYDAYYKNDITYSIEAEPFDIILMDIRGVARRRKSNMEGFAIACEIKSKYPLKRVCCYSGSVHQEISEQLADRKIDAFWVKDIDIDKMCEKIDNLIMEYADVEKQWEVLREELVKNKISEEDIRRIREAYFEGFKKGNFAELNIVTMETIKNASTMLNIVNSILTLIKVLAV